jgi:hypothetical protein
MKQTRRDFLTVAASASALSLVRPALGASTEIADSVFEQAAARPVFQPKTLKEPITIETVELLRKGRDHFVRVRSKEGAEGISVDDGRMAILHPIMDELIIP